MLILSLLRFKYPKSTTFALKDLFVLRHAEATLPAPPQEDVTRPLTAQGVSDAAQLGVYWHQQDIRFDQIVASPAVRTAKTASLVATHATQPVPTMRVLESLYEGPLDTTLVMMQQWEDAWQQVLLVSHQPLIRTLLTYLTDEQVLDIPPCSYRHVRLNIAAWTALAAGTGKVVSTGYPEDYMTAQNTIKTL